MATYGSGQMLGSGINPESFKQDYSGFSRAAEIQAQGLSNLGGDIAGAIKNYGEMKKSQQEDERAVQKSKSVAKAIGDLIPDLKPTLLNSLTILDNKELPLSQRKAEAEAISDILNLGIGEIRNRSSVDLEKQKIGVDKAYREAQLEAAKRAAAAAELEAPPTKTTSVSGGDQDVQWDKASRTWVPIQTSGLNAAKPAPTTSNLIDFVKNLEGFSQKSYDDYKQRSIGYGTKAKPGEVGITEQDATDRLGSELSVNAKRIEEAAKLKGTPLSQNQFNALASFDYNTGQGVSLIERFGDKPQELADKMLEYTKAGGKELPGLVNRRRIEAALFLSQPNQQQTSGMQGMVGFKPDKPKDEVETFSPATVDGVRGQVSNLTKRFYPDKPSSAELKLEYLEKAAAAYAAGDKQKALRFATAAGVGGLYGNLTIKDLDEYFMGSVQPPPPTNPVAPQESPNQGVNPQPAPQAAPKTKRSLEEIAPTRKQ